MIDWVINQLNTNDMLTGIMGGSLFAGLLYSLRSVPGYVYQFTKAMTTSTARFVNDRNEDFDDVLRFFQEHPPLFRHSKFSVISKYEDDGIVNFLGIGYGTHYFKVNGVYTTVDYSYDSEGSGMRKIRETIEITALTRKGSRFFNYLNEQVRSNKRVGTDVFVHNGYYWGKVKNVQERPLSTVFLPDQQKDGICDNIDKFLSARDWYVEKGIPWRLSFLFSGKPGSGKTSMALALATHFKLPLYYLALGSVDSDSDLMEAMRNIPQRSFVIIEDIDCAESSNKRKVTKKDTGSEEKEEDNEGITLSGLLNSIDGILAPQGRILIMTTNCPDKLDDALLRKGRVDFREEFEFNPLSNEQIFKRIAPGLPVPDLTQCSPAEAQAHAIELKETLI